MNEETIYKESQKVNKTVLKIEEIDQCFITLLSYTGLEILNGLLYYLLVIVGFINEFNCLKYGLK